MALISNGMEERQNDAGRRPDRCKGRNKLLDFRSRDEENKSRDKRSGKNRYILKVGGVRNPFFNPRAIE